MPVFVMGCEGSGVVTWPRKLKFAPRKRPLDELMNKTHFTTHALTRQYNVTS